MIKREPRGSARMYYSHVMWLHVFDVNTEIFNLELSVSLITSAETRFCAPADRRDFSRVQLRAPVAAKITFVPVTTNPCESRRLFARTHRPAAFSSPASLAFHRGHLTRTGATQPRAFAESGQECVRGRFYRVPVVATRAACARTRDPPIDRPLTSQPRPIAFFHPSQWLPDPEPPRT